MGRRCPRGVVSDVGVTVRLVLGMSVFALIGCSSPEPEDGATDEPEPPAQSGAGGVGGSGGTVGSGGTGGAGGLTGTETGCGLGEMDLGAGCVAVDTVLGTYLHANSAGGGLSIWAQILQGHRLAAGWTLAGGYDVALSVGDCVMQIPGYGVSPTGPAGTLVVEGPIGGPLMTSTLEPQQTIGNDPFLVPGDPMTMTLSAPDLVTAVLASVAPVTPIPDELVVSLVPGEAWALGWTPGNRADVELTVTVTGVSGTDVAVIGCSVADSGATVIPAALTENIDFEVSYTGVIVAYSDRLHVEDPVAQQVVELVMTYAGVTQTY